LNESFLRTISSSTTRKSSDGNMTKDSKLNSTQNTSLNQSSIKDNENPRPRRLSTAKKSKKEQ